MQSDYKLLNEITSKISYEISVKVNIWGKNTGITVNGYKVEV